MHRYLEIEEVVRPAIEEKGCELFGLEKSQTGSKSVLRIYIDKPGGVVIDDISAISRQISLVLDVKEIIKGRYILEVSSPGMDRPLFTPPQFVEQIGSKLDVRLSMPIEGRKNFKGKLVRVEENQVELETADNQSFQFDIEQIDRAKVIPDFTKKGV